MNRPPGGDDCPPGLEYLTTIDQLLVKQEIELLECKISSSNICSIKFNNNNNNTYSNAQLKLFPSELVIEFINTI